MASMQLRIREGTVYNNNQKSNFSFLNVPGTLNVHEYSSNSMLMFHLQLS